MFILEEAEEMPNFDDWDKVKKSIRVKDVQNLNILILNPTTKTHWIYDEFFESRGISSGWNGVKDNVMYIHSSYLDMERKFIPDNHWEDFESKRLAYEEWIKLPPHLRETSKLKKAAKYYIHVIMGGWLEKNEGVIFENWTLGQFIHNDNMIWGCDFGFSIDPTTLVHISIDKSQQKIWLKEECYKPKMTTDDIAELMQNRCGKDLVIADSAEPRLIDELTKKGLNVKPAVKGAGSIREGIALLLNYELIIDPSSLNLVKEMNNYAWNDKKSETPIDAWNHLIDAIRYGVTHALTEVERIHEFGW